jgi:hypothetical protein
VYFGLAQAGFAGRPPSSKTRDDRIAPREWLAVLGSRQGTTTPPQLSYSAPMRCKRAGVRVSRAHVWFQGGAGTSTAAAHSAQQHCQADERAKLPARRPAWQRQQIARLNVISSHLVYY